jgi:protoporphyrinogen/coproporphyrinogen III oxidase
MKILVVGGGIAGLAAAHRLEALVPSAGLVVVDESAKVGGKLQTERADGFVIEAAPDSFLSRKPRGVGLCRELELAEELVGRRPENPRSFVRRGGELHPLPEGLTGMIPTDLEALADSPLLSQAGKERLAAEVVVPPAPPDGDESIASFVSRRLGPEAYEAFVEPLMTGIYGGDGDQLSLQATFPQLRALELEHGSLLRGLHERPSPRSHTPPFVSLRDGMDRLVEVLVAGFSRTTVETGAAARAITRAGGGYRLELDGGSSIDADGVIVAVPPHVAASVLATLDAELAELHAGIPSASSVVVSLGYDGAALGRALDGYGYVVTRSERTDVLACTWTSSKWEGRAPDGRALVRVYAGRFGGRDLTTEPDAVLVELARDELGTIGISAEPVLTRVHRWPHGMPQYVLGHPDRLEQIDEALDEHPGLALAGAAYRGVGIPDCIASGEHAAESLARTLARVAG